MTFSTFGKRTMATLACATALSAAHVGAQTLSNNSTGTNNGFYYTFWKDSGSATMTLHSGGRYASQWTNNTNNWVGGKGWNPGGERIVTYSGNYGVDQTQNSYIALYGWTKSPLIEYYVIESYGSYNPSTCSGGTDYGSFQSDGATYSVRRCQRVQQPSIEGTATFYQYFSVRNPKKGFGNISGTITVKNHFDFWRSKGLNLGNHDYMVLATEGYQSRGSSDLTIGTGTASGGGGGGTTQPPVSSTPSTGAPNTGGVVVRARGAAGGESISLKISGTSVATWNLTTTMANYTYTGTASGDIQVEYTNDGGSRDAIIDYIQVNGETRQAEDMEYNTGNYANGSCGGGSYSETLHCNGAIGFGFTYDCFSGNCTSGTGGGTTSSPSGNTGGNTGGGSTANCSGYVAITFDDGPNASTTRALINSLKQHNLTPVTWFNQGNYVQSNPSLIAEQLTVGEVQNHSFTHPQMGSMSVQQITDELSRTNQAIQNAGAPKPTLFRPPYGTVNNNVNQAAQSQGLRVVTWDVDSEDWNGASASAIAAAANRLTNGQVILLHDGTFSQANNAISQIASTLRAKNLCPGRIDPTTGRAVAPSNNTGTTPPPASSSSSSTPAAPAPQPSSSSAPAAGGACQCNWWGTRYPICTSTASGWGWENNKSCITTSTCGSQGQGGGGVVCN